MACMVRARCRQAVLARGPPRPPTETVGPAQGPCTGIDGAAGMVGSVVAHVSTPVYEGPFDVLLQLVSDHKVYIYDIRVSDLVDGFIAEMAARQPFDVQTA